MSKKITLVLGGGGARGLAHIGILKILEENKIQISTIIGTSIGALVGGMYAAGLNANQLKEIAIGLNHTSLVKLFSPKFSSYGLLDSNHIRAFLKKHINEPLIENLQIPFFAVSTDLMTGEEVVINRGSLIESIIASISIPGIFVPSFYNGRYLVDGGLVDPLPVEVAVKNKFKPVIAVNIIPDPTNILNKISKEKTNEELKNKENLSIIKNRLIDKIQYYINNSNKMEEKKDESTSLNLNGKIIENISSPPNLTKTLLQSFTILSHQILTLRLKECKPHLIIQPDLGNIEVFEFLKGKELIENGEKAALQSLKKIEKLAR